MTLMPYIIVARFDKPAAIFLLLCPCYWGLAYGFQGPPPLYWMGLLALGAAVMRGAGCVFNDWVDRGFDAQVERTKNRPFARGQLSALQGGVFFCFLCLVGVGVLFQLPLRCWFAGLCGFALLGVYPFMKRLTHWPQAVLGLAFNSGLWVGALIAGPLNSFDCGALSLLYAAGIFWTIGYDTIYAFQDLEDDLKIGLKSTAVRFSHNPILFVLCSYGLSLFLFLIFGVLVQASVWYFSLIGLGAIVIFKSLWTLNPGNVGACFTLFKQNKWIGIGLFIALVLK